MIETKDDSFGAHVDKVVHHFQLRGWQTPFFCYAPPWAAEHIDDSRLIVIAYVRLISEVYILPEEFRE